LYEIGPGNGVEDILRGGLALVIITGGLLPEVITGRLPGAGRKCPGQYPSFGGVRILTGDLNIIVRNARVHKIPLELLPGGAGLDDRSGQELGIRDH